jgi:putative molybdopterin biosynthesis protein
MWLPGFSNSMVGYRTLVGVNLLEREKKVILRNTFLGRSPPDNQKHQKNSQDETLLLEHVNGCILAEDVFSSIDVPAFDRSVKDGFAVRAQDTYNATEIEPLALVKIGSIAAGCVPDLALGPGEAIEIATGAPIPEGADAVVMVEHTSTEADKILVRRAVYINENIMRTGADIMKGERVLRKNVRIGPLR